MRRVVLLSSVVMTGWAFGGFGETGDALAQCVTTTDCASLGYTESSCPNGGIKCPFGTTWSCKENYDSKNDDINCTYGSIYYNDGTCMKEFVSGSIPIGIVVYVDLISKEKWVMALEELTCILGSRTRCVWATDEYKGVDIPELESYVTALTASSDIKSCENTDILLAKGEDNFPAAKKARDYTPLGGENTKGKWCLPAAGIFAAMYNNAEAIELGISKITGATSFSQAGEATLYWTSTEALQQISWKDTGLAWIGTINTLSTGEKYLASSASGGGFKEAIVRPVMKI